MIDEPVEPRELVVELRSGGRIAVGQIEAGDDHPVHRRLDVAAVQVVRICGESSADLMQLPAARQDRHAVPARLSLPHRLIAERRDRLGREAVLRRLQLLQADDIGLPLLEPAQQHGQPAVNAIHVVGGDLHRPSPATFGPTAAGRKVRGAEIRALPARRPRRTPVRWSSSTPRTPAAHRAPPARPAGRPGPSACRCRRRAACSAAGRR